MEASSCHLHVRPLPHPRLLVSPGKKLVHIFGALVFVAATKGTPLDSLVLVTSGACTQGSHRTIVTETVLGWLYTQGIVQRQQIEIPSVSIKEAYLLILIAEDLGLLT